MAGGDTLAPCAPPGVKRIEVKKTKKPINSYSVNGIASYHSWILRLSANFFTIQNEVITIQAMIEAAHSLPEESQRSNACFPQQNLNAQSAVIDEGQVFVWGYGILGKGPELQASDTPTMIPEPLFGRNEIQPDSRVVDIDCGLGHFVALTNSGDVYSWGHNRQGCLGLGFTRDQFFPFRVSVPAEAHTVMCGVDHVIALCTSFS